MDVTRCLLVALILLIPRASDRPAEIPLWPAGAPGSEGKPATEVVTTSASGELSVSGIHNPSITPYLPAKDKADVLINEGSKLLPKAPEKWEPNLVCVLENGMFDAAGYVFDQNELEAFTFPDRRRRTWLIVPNAAVRARYVVSSTQ